MAEYDEEVEESEMLTEHIDLLVFSTPVKCPRVRLTVESGLSQETI